MTGTQRARAALVGLTIAALALVTIDFRMGDDGPLAELRESATSLFAPIQRVVSGIVDPVVAAARGVGDSFGIESENAALRDRVAELERTQLDYAAVVDERDQLLDLLDVVSDVELGGTGARVIANSASNFEWLVTIDAGADDGVALDQPVVNGDGLVGRVIQVGESSARVLLAIDPTFHATSRTAGAGEVGTVQGQGGELLKFTPVDPEGAFGLGDDLTTAAFDRGLYPTGIPIGTVEDPGDNVSGMARTVRVRPYVDFTGLDLVFVVDREAEAELGDIDLDGRTIPPGEAPGVEEPGDEGPSDPEAGDE